MLESMTGFGRAEVALPPKGRAVVEIQTLNHKFLEVECRLPEGLQGLEEQIRSGVGREIRRGRVRISVVLKYRGTKTPIAFQTALARQYITQLRTLQKQLKIPGAVRLETILNLPQVMTAPESNTLPEHWWPSLRGGVSRALFKVVKMRRQEGARLSKELTRLVQGLEGLQRKVRRRVPLVQRELQKRMAARIQAAARSAFPMAGDLLAKEERTAIIAQAAVFVQANDVSEELARISSHIGALRKVLGGQSENPGRTIDFLAQELHREVNTLGAKVRDTTVVQWVVTAKGQIEKLREQAANIE